VLRNKQYQILKELGSLDLINNKLSREISDNIEAVFKTDSNMKTEDKMQLTELVEVKYQLMVEATHLDDRLHVRRQPAGQQLLPRLVSQLPGTAADGLHDKAGQQRGVRLLPQPDRRQE